MNIWNWCDKIFKHPAHWKSKPLRRAYVLLFPIALPIHLALITAILLAMLIFVIALIPIVWAIEIWTGDRP